MAYSAGEERKGSLRLWDPISDHLGLLVSALFVLTVVFKVLVVSHWHPTTVAALLQTRSGPEIAVAALVLGLVNAAWIGAYMLTGPRLAEAVREADPLYVPATMFVLNMVLVALVSPWKYLVAVGAYTAIYLVMSVAIRVWRRRRDKRFSPLAVPRPLEWGINGAVLLLVVWLALLGSASPWIPPENLTLRAGAQWAGYVLETDAASFTVMKAADRTVVRIDAERLLERQFCSAASGDRRSLVAVALQLESPRYPKCWD